MSRLRAAALILAALFLLTLIGQRLVSGSLDSLEAGLTQVEKLCADGSYQAAKAQIGSITQAYQKQQAVLALFIRRDKLSELENALCGLSAYAHPDYLQDLLCETGKLKAQLNGIRRLFFGLL
ncbi:DUF4363 family protein [uncultured Allofournierella sp.]|uniref:DUF4363 family protein n=1 Tax=uncultured Allofournierella sp. TaxID=1940258 RepID=UPI0025E6769F|nr:DUF4363 family protein [uncultured Fournierella sp.]